jgi:putative flippase GtrA
VRDSWRIYKLILAHFFRYTLASLTSSLVELILLYILTLVLPGNLSWFALTAIPAVSSRVISSLLNFYMNKKLVFQSKVATGTALLRYYLLAIPTLLSQLALTHGLFTVFSISEEQPFLRTVIHTAVMVVLFIVTFVIQKRWVFAFASICFVLVGAPLGIRAQRKESSIGMAISLGVALSYYMVIILMSSLSKNFRAQPEFLIWIPVLVCMLLASYLVPKNL